jgi:hypothetical protein
MGELFIIMHHYGLGLMLSDGFLAFLLSNEYIILVLSRPHPFM